MVHVAEMVQTLGILKGLIAGGIIGYIGGYVHCKIKNKKQTEKPQ